MTFAEYTRYRPDLLYNWERANQEEFENDETAIWIRSFGSFENYVRADYGGRDFDPDVSSMLPPPVVGLPPPTIAAGPISDGRPGNEGTIVPVPMPRPIDDGPITSTGPTTPTPAQNATSPGQMPSTATRSPAMTAAQYAASRPDLVNNYNLAFTPQYANDPVAEWIRSFPSLDAYLAQDYGQAFASGGTPATTGTPTGGSSTTPPPTNNSGGPSSIVSDNDKSILAGIDSFLQAAGSILTGFNNAAKNLSGGGSTTTPPATTQTQQKSNTLMIVGIAAAIGLGIYVARRR